MATQDAVNEDGLRTGEKETIYSDFKVAYVSISIAKSLDSFEPFGTSLNYDYTMYCDDMNCEIDENTLIWLNNSVEEKHDHIVIETNHGWIVYNDARRFGLFTYTPTENLQKSKYFCKMGIDPFDSELNGIYLLNKIKNLQI